VNGDSSILSAASFLIEKKFSCFISFSGFCVSAAAAEGDALILLSRSSPKSFVRFRESLLFLV
jgi:hypothetical protein